MKFSKFIFFIVLLSIRVSASAQLNGNCPGCVSNVAQFGTSISDYAVGLFPDTIVVTQNQPVNIDITYLLPKLAATGISIAPTATVTEVQILGINATTPLPSGLSVTCDRAATSCAYYPQTYRFGCVKICGTTPDPATNGFVLAKITVAGTGSAAGQTQTQNQDISFYYKILPDTSACHTVCFQNKINSGCDSATIGVLAGIDINCASPILNPCSFDWAYGNGQTGSSLTVTPETYSSPGTYPVSLTKRIMKLQITAASFTVPPDPTLFGIACFSGCAWYNNICNGSGINNGANNFDLNITVGSSNYNTGGAGGGNVTGSFTGLGYDVTNQAVSLYVHDRCLLSNLQTATTTFTITGPGVYSWAIGSDANGSITVSEVPKDSVTYTDSVYIYASPATPLITASKDSLCLGDSARLSISSQYAGYTINWYQDTTYLTGQTDTFITVQNQANYTATVINPASHCKSTSAPYTLAVSSQPPFAATLYYQSGQHQLFINPFAAGSYADWYYDSTLVTGQHGQFLPSLGNGTYYVNVYPTGYPLCNLISPLYTLNLNTGINDAPNEITNLSVYPNPNNGSFTLRVNVLTQGTVNIKITDMLGRSVYERSMVNQSGDISDNINVSGLAKNVYTLEVTIDKGRATKRVVVE